MNKLREKRAALSTMHKYFVKSECISMSSPKFCSLPADRSRSREGVFTLNNLGCESVRAGPLGSSFFLTTPSGCYLNARGGSERDPEDLPRTWMESFAFSLTLCCFQDWSPPNSGLSHTEVPQTQDSINCLMTFNRGGRPVNNLQVGHQTELHP